MSLELNPAGGRYPGGRVLYEAANIRAWLEMKDDRVTIRVEDRANSDRWESFMIPTRQLPEELLRHREEEEELPDERLLE